MSIKMTHPAKQIRYSSSNTQIRVSIPYLAYQSNDLIPQTQGKNNPQNPYSVPKTTKSTLSLSQNEEYLKNSMKASSNSANNSSHPRKQQASISSTVVHCICITASCVATACGLLGFGVTCFTLRLADPLAAPCPFVVTVTVFGVAGLLFFISSFFLVVLCRRRNRLRRKAMLEDLPVAAVEEEFKPIEAETSKVVQEKENGEENKCTPDERQDSDDNFEMTQKSADVSLWIEYQDTAERAVDCFPLEPKDGTTSQDHEEESSDEITPL